MSPKTLSKPEFILPSPTSLEERIKFLDVVRGIAVLGILVMNITGMGQSFVFYNTMDLSKPVTGPNFYTWIIQMSVFQGVMRGLFSLLFGAGAVLLLDRLEKKESAVSAADIYYRRLLWLLLLGIINAYIFLWSGDILYFYALLGLVLFPFRKMSPRRLLVPIVVILLFGIWRETSMLNDRKAVILKGRQAELLQSRHQKLSAETTADLEKWQAYKKESSSEGLMKKAAKETATIQNSNLDRLTKTVWGESAHMESTLLFNGWWDMLLFFFVGMAFYKSGFLAGLSKTWVYLAVAVIGLSAGFCVDYFQLRDIYHARFDFISITEHASPIAFNQLKRVFQVSGTLSLLVLLYRLRIFRSFLNIFSPVGQMALSNYLSQSIIAAVFFFGLGRYGKFERYQLMEFCVAVWIFQIIFSAVWLRYFKFGPFEWAWRSLTYLKWQGFRIEAMK
jgi:uncharacterized protein